VTAAQLRTAAKPGSSQLAATSAAAPPARGEAQRPAMLTSLLDNVVDTTGNSELDDILYGNGGQ
jgi:hypothetical protein